MVNKEHSNVAFAIRRFVQIQNIHLCTSFPLCSSYIAIVKYLVVNSYAFTRYATLPPGSIGVYDPTEIRNRGAISKFQTENFIKIGYSIVAFLLFLYWYELIL